MAKRCADIKEFAQKLFPEAQSWVALDTLENNAYSVPCYIKRWTVTEEVNSTRKIKEYIRLARKGDEALHLFSITEADDEHYKLWLEVAAGMDVWVLDGKSNHGDYHCWSIVVPRRG